MTAPAVIDLPFDIACMDVCLFRPGMACSYLVRGAEGYAVIETGTTRSVPIILGVLAAKGIAVEDVRYVMPTHVHLDHAGGAGALLQHLPRATLVVHSRGVRHMADPGRLWEGASAVYGEDMLERSYGRPVPVPVDRILTAEEGMVIDLGGRRLALMDTPGHARHHYSVYDARSRGIFTGDTFGVSYRDTDSERGAFVMPTTTPVQFDPEAWNRTLDRYLALEPQRMFPTHFSMVEDVARLAADLRTALEGYVAIARQADGKPDRHARIRAALLEYTLAGLREHRCRLSGPALVELLEMDMDLNTQGLEVWLDAARTPH